MVQIHLLSRTQHRPHQMILRQPLHQRRRHRQQLTTITTNEIQEPYKKRLKPARRHRLSDSLSPTRRRSSSFCCQASSEPKENPNGTVNALASDSSFFAVLVAVRGLGMLHCLRARRCSLSDGPAGGSFRRPFLTPKPIREAIASALAIRLWGASLRLTAARSSTKSRQGGRGDEGIRNTHKSKDMPDGTVGGAIPNVIGLAPEDAINVLRAQEFEPKHAGDGREVVARIQPPSQSPRPIARLSSSLPAPDGTARRSCAGVARRESITRASRASARLPPTRPRVCLLRLSSAVAITGAAWVVVGARRSGHRVDRGATAGRGAVRPGSVRS